MKDLTRKISVLIVIIFLTTATTFAQLKMGVKFGLSVPNENLSKVASNIKDASDTTGTKELEQIFLNESKSGYHLIATGYISLGSDIDLTASIGINRFTESKIQVRDFPDTTKIIATLLNTRNVIPIEVGVKYKVTEIGIISLYTIGNISYNYISTSTDVDYNVGFTSFGFPIQSSQTDRRIGYGIGAGLQLDFSLVKAFLEFKANGANLLGRNDGENMKNFYTLSAGVIL